MGDNDTLIVNQTGVRSAVRPPEIKCGLDLESGELPIIMLLSMVVDSLAVIVLWRMRGASDSVDHMLVSVLNLNDLLTTAIYTLMWICGWSTCGRILYVEVLCGVAALVASALLVWSAYIVLLMSIVRCLSLVKPFYYRSYVNSRMVVKWSVGTLVLCLIIFMFPFTGTTKPYKVYTENLICGVDFAPGGHSIIHRTYIGCIGLMGCTMVIGVLVCNFLIVKTLGKRNMIHTGTTTTISKVNTGMDTPASYSHSNDNTQATDTETANKQPAVPAASNNLNTANKQPAIPAASSNLNTANKQPAIPAASSNLNTTDKQPAIPAASNNLNTANKQPAIPAASNNLNTANKQPALRTTNNNLNKRRMFQRVTLVLSFVYVVCYAPFVFRLVVDTVLDVDHQEGTAHSVTISLVFVSPLVNPFVYGLFNKYFREAFINLMLCRKKERGQGSEPSQTRVRTNFC